MNVYVDTSLIVKMYVAETNSELADTILQGIGAPVPFSHLHALEIPNAIHLKRFRNEITKTQETEALRAFKNDIQIGRLERINLDWVSVFNLATLLSEKYSYNVGTRSMDILHVAAAIEAKCPSFATFDQRQQILAKKAGLKIIPQ